jgi:predicted butyrate kinase (DUF1464 family)
MVRVIGIDPGTKSFDFCGLEDDKVILDTSVPTSDIIKNPELLSDIIKKTGAGLVVGPSGFGIPVTAVKEIGDRELFRSEERRVGKECRRLCRSRWSPYH